MTLNIDLLWQAPGMDSHSIPGVRWAAGKESEIAMQMAPQVCDYHAKICIQMGPQVCEYRVKTHTILIKTHIILVDPLAGVETNRYMVNWLTGLLVDWLSACLVYLLTP